MIPYAFAYYRPDSLKEASDCFAQLKAQGKSAVCYSGGSEIITMCRAGSIRPDAVIDIKDIPQCQVLYADDQALHMGSACTLSQITDAGLFPLLKLSCGRIADHSNQCRITLGGNLCGAIMYREASLPLLLADADITLSGPKGERRLPLESVFPGRMKLDPGELVVQLHVPLWALPARHFHIKKTTNEKIDYPLVSVAALCKDGRLRLGFSGICSHPFRGKEMEDLVNDRGKTRQERARLACGLLPEPARTDGEGSGEYRLFVFQNTLCELLEEWENGTV